ncbi:MAG: GTPase [Sedimentisphaerales bacterium]
MSAFAAVTTGKGIGAIAVIQVFGDLVETFVKKIFNPAGGKPAVFKPGKILLGTISNGAETIDQVTIGCEGHGHFAINCHGNPLIVADIMQLLQRQGVILLTAEELLAKIFSAEGTGNTIALEAKLTLLRAKTIQGTKIIANQIDAGLTKKTEEWLQSTISLEQIKADAEQILKNSKAAKLIIFGCTIAIAGPPNTGKSTLLNFLAGKQKAIVTDIAGTTRDWVSAECRIGPLSVRLIDTAGLDEKLTSISEDTIDKASQQKSVEILDKTDLVLVVLDNNQPAEPLDENLIEKIAEKRIVAVLNKCDLPARFDVGKLPKILANTTKISAKFGDGIENLYEKIRQICNVDNFDLKSAVCITDRQENLLKQLQKAKSKQQAVSIITELLNGRLSV